VGVTCLSLLVLTLWKAGLLVFDSRLIFGSAILRYEPSGCSASSWSACSREYLTRATSVHSGRGLAGVYQWAFKTRRSKALGFWTAAVIFSILSASVTAAPRRVTGSDCFPPAWPLWSYASASGAPARSGGPSLPASWTGPSFLYGVATAESWCSTVLLAPTP